MDELIKGFERLSLNSAKKSTGLVYHPETLLHTYDPDEVKCRVHVENPLRVKKILERLQEKGLVDRCDFVEKFGEIDPKIVAAVHGEDYLDYLMNLWPEGSKKSKMAYTDSYYNMHTTHAALLAAEGARLTIDNVYSGKWKNGFALIRPPGHHAAAKENKLQGFCMINNVVVGIKDLTKRVGRLKVAIFDWDVHHGDASQKMLWEDPSTLYVSIHRFQNGSFYPGNSGDVTNVGGGPGEGYNLNFPVNAAVKQWVGDSEYIYVFERAILPIFKQFAPEMIVISCGFDCLINDPLGHSSVTANGLSYMLLRLQQEVTDKIAIVLEGGYNLEELPLAAESLIRVLLGEYYPNAACRSPSSRYQLLKTLNLSTKFLKNADENFAVWKRYWPCLSNDDFEKKVKAMACDPFCVPRKHKYVTCPEWIKKTGASRSELETYQQLLSKFGAESLHKLLPKMLKHEEVDSKINVVYENLNPSAKMSVINLVLPNTSMECGITSETFQKYKCYIRAYQITDAKGEVLESRRDHQLNVPLVDTFDYLLRCFHYHRLNEKSANSMTEVVDFLQAYLAFCQANKISFSQPRLLIFVNPADGTVVCRLSNIREFEECLDVNTTHCVEGAVQLLEELRAKVIQKAATKKEGVLIIT